jgi:hypothetical protein
VIPLVILAALLAACAPAPPPASPPKPDPTKQAWYGESADRLTAMAREAEAAFHQRKMDQAAAIVTRCQPLSQRLLSAPQPTLPALQAVSDVDQLYGQMLMANGHYVWARDFFQKNLIRWTNWKPRTDDAVRRLNLARSAIAECDRKIGGQ